MARNYAPGAASPGTAAPGAAAPGDVDYKTITKVLANRMKKNLVNIIHHNQTGLLKSRYIGENVRLLLNIINFTDTHNIPCFAFVVDSEKAFDIKMELY